MLDLHHNNVALEKNQFVSYADCFVSVLIARESVAAIKLQASWRGFLARRKNLDVVRARNEIRNRRAEDHIRFLQSEVHR